MTNLGFEALRAAVNIAKDRQVQTIKALRRALKDRGFGEEAITEAFTTWKQHLERCVAQERIMRQRNTESRA